MSVRVHALPEQGFGRYRRTEKNTFEVTCGIHHDQVCYDAASDGCWR
jgi:hypothetical protein